nr:30S ribosomal protein S2 [Candidatus Cloacimonadota bacterium]
HRWFGGILTNLKTIRKSIDKLEHFENLRASGEIEKYTKLEVLKMQRKYDKILNALGGIRDMDNLPSAIVIADTVNEKNALREAQKLGVPIVAIVDTNSNPDGIDFVIPGNDDAMKSVNLICDIMANAINEGKKIAAEGGDIEEILKESKEVEKVSQKEKVEEIIEEEKTSEEKKEKLVIEDSKKKTKKEKTVKVKKKFICEYCDKEFTSRRGLKIHLGLVHQK